MGSGDAAGLSVPVSGSSQRPDGFRVPGLRWWISGLLFAATLISYIDRLTLSVLAPVVCADLHLSNLQYATISVWFLLAYSFGQTIFGVFQDKFGTRRGLCIAMLVWSIAEALQATARGFGAFCSLRFVLGLGEGGHWPAAIKGIAEWFPEQERALGIGIINTGATLGSAAAPPLIVWLQFRFGWRATFVVTGFLGFVWIVLWLLCYRTPERHRRLRPEELAWIQNQPSGREVSAPAPSWRSLFRDRRVLGITIARFLGDPVWWLFLVWLPLYLYKDRGLSLTTIGFLAWIPFLLADAGALSGGWFSGWLVRRGWKPPRARGAAILIATVLAPLGALVTIAQSVSVAIVFISVELFAFQFWINNVQTLVSDYFPNETVASVSGLAGTSAGIGAMIFMLCTGWVVDHLGYSPILIFSGFLVPVATVALAWYCGRQVEGNLHGSVEKLQM